MKSATTDRVLACTIYRAGVLISSVRSAESLSIGTDALTKAEAMETFPHRHCGVCPGAGALCVGDFRKAIDAFQAGRRHLVGDKALIRLGTTGTAAVMCAST